jgi:hypothetical protein
VKKKMKKTITIFILALMIVPVISVTATENGIIESEKGSISGVLFPSSNTFKVDENGKIPKIGDTDESPNMPIIIGPTVVEECERNSYFVKSIDPEGDDVFFKISWGDGAVIYWDGPHKSGEEVRFDHAWCPVITPGATKFTIKVLVKDVNENIGKCGNLEVTIANNVHKSSIGSSLTPRVEKVLELFPILENILCKLINFRYIPDFNTFKSDVEGVSDGIIKGGNAIDVEVPSSTEEIDFPVRSLIP